MLLLAFLMWLGLASSHIVPYEPLKEDLLAQYERSDWAFDHTRQLLDVEILNATGKTLK